MRFKIVVGAVLLLAGAGIATWLWIEAAVERRWTSMQKRIAELTAEARAREHRRPERPGLIPGDAWNDYLEALDILAKDPQIEAVLPNWSPQTPDSAQVEALMDRNPRVLELIHRGARRATARHPDLIDDDFDSTHMGSLRRLSAVCEVVARRLAREGKVREAAEVLLDLLQLGNDARRDAIFAPERIQKGFHETAVEELLALKLADTEKVVREIERLEADLPSYEAHLRDEMLRKARTIGDPNFRAQLTAWQARRFAFSTRMQLADAFERGEELLRGTAGIDALSFAQAQGLEEKLDLRLWASGNVALRALFPEFTLGALDQRMNLARLRMLRAMLHVRATGDRLDLSDPFGTTLRWSPPGNPLRIWSVYVDGVDDGGKVSDDFVLTIP